MTKTVQIEIPDECESMMHGAIASGEFKSEPDIVQAALRDWQDRRLLENLDSSHLRRLWNEGVQSGEGRGWSIEDIKSEARKKLAASKP